MQDVAAQLTDRCGVCGALLDEEDLFCANCGTECPQRTTTETATASRQSTLNFTCQGCGASMSYDASASALRCPFCGATDLEQQPDAKILAPRVVVPFGVDRQRAIDILRQWLGRGMWRPGDLATAATVSTIAACYVPYWVFAAETHTFWTADTNQTPAFARANWYPLSGEHRGRYEGLLVGASTALTVAETVAIAPFDLATGQPPEQVDLDNVTVEQFSLPRKYARPVAQQGLEALELEACRGEVPGSSRNVKVNVKVVGQTSTPVLLPVWIVAYRYHDELFRFLVNGQTGRATGRKPFSWNKLAVVVGVAGFLLIFLLFFLSRR